MQLHLLVISYVLFVCWLSWSYIWTDKLPILPPSLLLHNFWKILKCHDFWCPVIFSRVSTDFLFLTFSSSTTITTKVGLPSATGLVYYLLNLNAVVDF